MATVHDDELDDMIRCTLCRQWYHAGDMCGCCGRCINCVVECGHPTVRVVGDELEEEYNGLGL